jgi:hypothetical protein
MLMTFHRSRWVTILLVILVTLAGFIFYWVSFRELGEQMREEAAIPTKPRPCRATFEQVTQGMTRVQVESVIGAPPGVYPGSKEGSIFLPMATGLRYIRYDQWVAEEAQLFVKFGNDGLVEAMGVHIHESFWFRAPIVQ